VRPADTFSNYIATLLKHIHQLLMHYEFTPGGKRILKACLERNMLLKLGTNGSYNMGKRNGIVWMGVDREPKCDLGSRPVDGVPTVLSST
jgi:hypothetical protein